MALDFKTIQRQIIFSFSQFLTVEYNLPQIIHVLSILYTTLHSTSYVFKYSHQSQQLNDSLTQISLLSRLHFYIINQSILNALFWTSTAIQHIIIISIISIAIFLRKYSTFKIINFMNSFYVYLISLTYYPFIIEICFLNTQSAIYICISIILLIEICIFMIIGEILYRRGLTLKSNTNLYINMTIQSYVIKLFKIVQIIIYFYLPQQQITQIIQIVLNILIQIIFITEIHIIKVYGKSLYNNFLIISSSVSLVITFDVLLTSSIFNRNYWILISILVIKILLNCEQQPQSLDNLSINHLKHLFNIIELSNPQKSITKLYVQLLFSNHIQVCDKKNNCVCYQYTNQDYYKALLHVIEIKIENYVHSKTDISKDLIYLDYAQILLRRHQYVKALQHISKSLVQNTNLYNKTHQPLSVFTILLLEFLKEQVLGQVMIQISEKIVLNHQNNKLITDSLKQFVINESTDQQIIINLKKIIQQKMIFYYQFIETQNSNCGNIHYAVQFIQQIQEFRENLIKRYDQFPTNTNQNLLKYFELNILNDYIESFQTNKGKAFEEDKYNQFSGQMYNKIFGVNPAYFITELNSDLNITVTKYSNKAYQLLDQWRVKQPISELNYYLPEYVINQHPRLIEEFLNDGKNKYYQQQNLAFIKALDKIMIPIQIMLSINATNSDRFSFLVFFYESQDYCSYIVANQNLDIINVSQNISESLFCCGSRTAHVKIERLIPNFQFLISKNQRQFFNQELKLIKENSHITSLQTFIGNIKIEKKFTKQQLCYFVELDNIRPVQKKITEEMSSTLYFIPTSMQQWNSTQKFLNINSELDSMCEKVIPYVDFEHKVVPENSLFILNNYEQQPINQTDTKDTHFLQTQQMLEYYKSQNFQEPLSQKRLLHSSKYSHDEDLKKQVNKIVEEDEFNEIGSTSSVTAIRKSKYFKKFEIITILMKSQRQSKKIVTMNQYLSLYVIVIIIGIIIQIVMIAHLKQFISDIQSLSVRYDVVEPYESFYVSRFSQVNYREQLAAGVINASVYAQLTKYPFSTFELMYNHLRDSMYKVLQETEIDQLTDNKLITIYFLNKNYTSYTKNVTIRSLVNILMNYQHDFKIGLTIKSVDFASPFFYFTSKNYLTIKNTFDGLNNIVLDATLQRSELEKQKWLFVLIPFLVATFLLSLFIIYQFREYNVILNQIFQYLLQIDQAVLDNEKQRLQKHLNIINNQIEKVKQFQFDIDAIDKELDESDTFRNKNIVKKSQNTFQIINHDFGRGVAILLVHLLTFLGFYFAIFIIIEDYLQKYDRTAVSFQKISDLGVDIPTMYAQREVLYRRQLRYFYLADKEIDGIYAIFFKAYSKVEQFSKDSLDISSNGYLFDDSAVNFFQEVKQGNLCDYQTEQFKQLSTTTCPIVMNGNLEKGLSQILPYILYTLKTQQFDSKNFTILPNNTRLELEGATILGNVMSTVISQLYQNLLDSCQLLIFYTQLPCIIILVLQFILFCIYAFIISPKIRIQFQSIKQSIFLFPRQTLIFDDQFYRNFRSIIKDEGIQQ